MKMSAELKQKWQDALRSGDYKQGQGRLGDPDTGFCCLGVLCQVAGIGYDPSRGFPNAGMYREMGVEEEFVDISIAMESTTRTLAKVNDLGMTFYRIADKIEKMVEVR